MNLQRAREPPKMTSQFRGSVVIFPKYGVTVQKPFIDINCFNELSVQNVTGTTTYPLDEAELKTHEVSKGKAAIKVMERDEYGELSEVVTIHLETKDDGERDLFDDAHTALTEFMAKVIAAQKEAKKAARKAGTARPPPAAAPAPAAAAKSKKRKKSFPMVPFGEDDAAAAAPAAPAAAAGRRRAHHRRPPRRAAAAAAAARRAAGRR